MVLKFFVSRLGGACTTYRIKTCRPKHKCGKAFKNKNATPKWVSKVTIESLRIRNDVKLTQIMDDVRFKYGIGISLAIA